MNTQFYPVIDAIYVPLALAAATYLIVAMRGHQSSLRGELGNMTLLILLFVTMLARYI